MKSLVILGAGTAGTIVANKLRRRLHRDEWQITIVDRDDDHLYQPGYLLLPFGVYRPDQLVKSRRDLLASGVKLVLGEIDRVDPQRESVLLRDGRTLSYDQLVIASGTSPRPDQTPGMLGPEWRRSIFDFYTLDGATALGDALEQWQGGQLVVHIVEMPIKCPVAPLEFTFLADDFFRHRSMRRRVEITYVTPLDGAFTKPTASKQLGSMLSDRDITIEPDFVVDHIDSDRKVLVSMDEREVPFDLLVTVPLNMGADYVARSGLGDELNYVAVDKATLLSHEYPNIFAIGDASDIPASKAGSAAHFSAEIFADNFMDHIEGRPLTHGFDGHASCFIESGGGKGMLIDFNYDNEPLPGKYPTARFGPFSLLAESRVNHWGKLGFRWAYWHLLLPGRRLHVPSLTSHAEPAPVGER